MDGKAQPAAAYITAMETPLDHAHDEATPWPMLMPVAGRSLATGIVGRQTVAAQKEGPSEPSEQWADPKEGLWRGDGRSASWTLSENEQLGCSCPPTGPL